MNNLSKTLNNDSEYSKQKIEDNDTLIEAIEPKIINNEQKQNDILNQKVKVDTSTKMDQNSLNININNEEKEQIRKIKYWVIISFINELNNNIKNEKLKIKEEKDNEEEESSENINDEEEEEDDDKKDKNSENDDDSLSLDIDEDRYTLVQIREFLKKKRLKTEKRSLIRRKKKRIIN